MQWLSRPQPLMVLLTRRRLDLSWLLTKPRVNTNVDNDAPYWTFNRQILTQLCTCAPSRNVVSSICWTPAMGYTAAPLFCKWSPSSGVSITLSSLLHRGMSTIDLRKGILMHVLVSTYAAILAKFAGRFSKTIPPRLLFWRTVVRMSSMWWLFSNKRTTPLLIYHNSFISIT